MSDARPRITPEMEAHIAASFARNRALYGGLRMEAQQSSGNGDGGSSPSSEEPGDGEQAKKPEEPKPSDTVDYWKRRSRENERRAKDNAEAAKRLNELEEAQKTEEQKRLDAEAKRKAETETLRVENLRLRAAGAHAVSGEDEEGVAYADLISGTDEESISRSAQAIGRLVAAAAERDQLKEQAEGRNARRAGSGLPSNNLRPGAMPPGDPAVPAGAAGVSEAERRFGSKNTVSTNS